MWKQTYWLTIEYGILISQDTKIDYLTLNKMNENGIELVQQGHQYHQT